MMKFSRQIFFQNSIFLMNRNCILLFTLLQIFSGISVLFGQNKGKPTWLDQAKSEHHRTRMAIGFRLFEPSVVSVQFFKGAFCSGHDTYAHKGTVEVYGGTEQFIWKKNRDYKGGKILGSGFQAGLNYQYPLKCLMVKNWFTFQLHAGAGLQAGSRSYSINERIEKESTFAGMAFLRFSMTGRGFKMMDRYWFWSAFTEACYYAEPGNSISRWQPAFGIVVRKVR
jgi:hypothetical protein